MTAVACRNWVCQLVLPQQDLAQQDTLDTSLHHHQQGHMTLPNAHANCNWQGMAIYRLRHLQALCTQPQCTHEERLGFSGAGCELGGVNKLNDSDHETARRRYAAQWLH